jgi:hypothetical protein
MMGFYNQLYRFLLLRRQSEPPRSAIVSLAPKMRNLGLHCHTYYRQQLKIRATVFPLNHRNSGQR